MDCKGEECNKYWSCKYLSDRFGVTECATDEQKKIMVQGMHGIELKNREEMLRGIKV